MNQLNEILFLYNNANTMKPALLKKLFTRLLEIRKVTFPRAITKINEKCPLSQPISFSNLALYAINGIMHPWEIDDEQVAWRQTWGQVKD